MSTELGAVQFGELNDVATLKALLDTPAYRDADSRQKQRAMGWLIGSRTLRAETDWSKARILWRKLERTDPFWR